MSPFPDMFSTVGNLNLPEVHTHPDSGEIAPAELRDHLVSSIEDVTFLDRVVPTW